MAKREREGRKKEAVESHSSGEQIASEEKPQSETGPDRLLYQPCLRMGKQTSTWGFAGDALHAVAPLGFDHGEMESKPGVLVCSLVCALCSASAYFPVRHCGSRRSAGRTLGRSRRCEANHRPGWQSHCFNDKLHSNEMIQRVKQVEQADSDHGGGW